MASGLDRMDSITAFDAFMHTADAGVSGGVRRSATIVVFDFWDRLMRESKTGPWRAKNKQRERANISALCQRGGITFEQFQEVFEATRQWGEPGFYWSSHPDMLPNPCVEIGFLAKLLVDPTTDDGHRLLKNYQGPIYRHDSRGDSLADETDATWGNKVCLSGWQMCNVTTMNGRTIQSEEDFYERCKYASLLGTWQAGFDKFPYLGEVSEKIVQREALLGVSICGMMHNPDLLFNPDVQRKGAFIVVRTNEEEAKLIGVNPSARTTCIKPDGNSASTLGSFSGVHPGKFKKGFRIVQASNNEAPYMHLRSVNPQACERHNSHTDVIRFCVEYKGKMEGDMTACEFLDYVKTTQINWVGGGKVKERCTEPWLSNNVSNTVRVRDSEWHAVAKKIYDNQEHYSGVSLISVYGDRDYQNAPFTSVYDEDEQAKTYGAAAASPEKDNLLRGSCVFANLWEACDLVLGLWGEGRTPSLVQANWAHDLTYFAGEYLNGDIRSATYCLKDAHNWALYVRLKESYVEVDYAEMVEEDNGINFQAEAGCVGGACET
jgi:ribonucleoside-diphosphate reductase alpha chain